MTIPVTKAARHENSSRSCRMMAIGNLPTQRRAIAQSSLVAKATRQEKSNKSFRVLMDIGPHLCSSIDYRSPIPWPNGDGGLAEFRRFVQSAFGPSTQKSFL